LWVSASSFEIAPEPRALLFYLSLQSGLGEAQGQQTAPAELVTDERLAGQCTAAGAVRVHPVDVVANFGRTV